MEGPDEKTNFYKIRKTVLKMLEDRGYIVAARDKNETLDNFRKNFKSGKDSLQFIVQRNNDPNDTLYVEYSDSIKLGVGDINNFAEVIHGQKIKTGIIINKGSITPLAKMKMNEFEEFLHIEYFEEKELLVNITEHELVPEHYPLNESDKKELLSRYRLKENQLPKILLSDPVARYLGLRRGQVVKIVRPSETAGRYVTYRIAF